MKKIGYSIITFLLFGTVMQGACFADPFLQYNNFDLEYRYTDPDPGTGLNGVRGAVSFSPFSNFFLNAGYGFDSSDDIDVNTFEYGGGFYFPLQQKIHLVANVGGKHAEYDFDGLGEFEVDRIYVGPELRARIHENVEVNFGYTWEDGEGDSTNNYNVGALFRVSDGVAAIAEIEFLDEDARYNGGVRFAF